MENNDGYQQQNPYQGQQQGQPYQQPPNMQQALPNSTTVLVLGILSIVFAMCYGVPGIIMGIIAVSISGKDIRLYQENPGVYTESSHNNLKAGRICGIIGICCSALFLLFIIFYFIFVGAMISSLPLH